MRGVDKDNQEIALTSVAGSTRSPRSKARVTVRGAGTSWLPNLSTPSRARHVTGPVPIAVVLGAMSSSGAHAAPSSIAAPEPVSARGQISAAVVEGFNNKAKLITVGSATGA
jgi:hypothetical protein